MVVSNLLKDLDNYLSARSYIDDYQPTQADLKVFDILKSKPTEETPHLLRWYNHIQSYDSTARKKFAQKSLKPEINTIISNTVTNEPKIEVEDDDVDLFGSDEEEDAEAKRIKEERLQAYAAKKSKKPAVVAKSSIILDVKPWDDETDMKEMEDSVRSIKMDGLLWGASSLKPVGYGIKKLQIMCVVEDEKVSVDDLVDQIQEFEDYVQSVDISAFNKI